MKDIDEMFKEILEKENGENITQDNYWILLTLFLALFNNNLEKEQPIINIYLGDE